MPCGIRPDVISTRPVSVSTTNVSTNTPRIATAPWSCGRSTLASAWAWGVEPRPASLENSPRLTPFISTAPKPPAATCRRPKASEKMRPSTAGSWRKFTAMMMTVITK